MGSVATPAEEILPLFPFDDTVLNRILSITSLFRYRGVLDANKLRDSLTTLLHTGNWRKLRGRLRLDENDKLYITIPPVANKQRPAIRYRQTVLGQPIRSHPLANKLAQPEPRSSVQEAIMSFTKGDITSFIMPPDWPRTLAEKVDPDRDEPILGLHILSFTDATLVCLNFSHVMMDGVGFESFLSAWSTVLSAGSSSSSNKFSIPDLCLTDPLSAVREQIATQNPPVERFVLQDQVILAASLMPEDGASANTDPDWDTSSRGSSWRTFSFSAKALAKIIAEARSTAPKGVFVSEDDAVNAFIIRTVSSTYPAQRPINAMRLYDMRGRLPGVFKDKREMAYSQNAYQMAWSLFDTAEQTRVLGEVGANLRRAIESQLTPGQVVAAMAGRADGVTPLYGKPEGAFFCLNSWAKMDVFRIADFSAAVVEEDSSDSSGGEDEEERGPVVEKGKPEFIDVDFDMGAPPPGPNFISTGTELSTGMRYGMGYLVGGKWETFERELRKLDE